MRYIIPIPATIVAAGSGTFHCKFCKRETSYCLKERIERGLLLFFFPFRGDVLETFVECQECGRCYPPDSLRGAPTEELKIVTAIKDRLLAGQSTQKIQEDLAKTGVADAVMKKYLRVAIGISKKICAQCNSTYHSSATKCTRCGVLLPKQENVQSH